MMTTRDCKYVDLKFREAGNWSMINEFLFLTDLNSEGKIIILIQTLPKFINFLKYFAFHIEVVTLVSNSA